MKSKILVTHLSVSGLILGFCSSSKPTATPVSENFPLPDSDDSILQTKENLAFKPRLSILKKNHVSQVNSFTLMPPIISSNLANRQVHFLLPSKEVTCQCFLSDSKNGTAYLSHLFQERGYSIEILVPNVHKARCKAHCDVEVSSF